MLSPTARNNNVENTEYFLKQSRDRRLAVKFTSFVTVLYLLVYSTGAFSQDTPQAILQRGLHLSDLYNWTAARPYLIQARQLFEASGDKRNALYAQLAAIRAGAEPIPLPERSYKLAQELATNPILQSDLELRMYCLAVKGEIDGEIDNAAMRSDWTEVSKYFATTDALYCLDYEYAVSKFESGALWRVLRKVSEKKKGAYLGFWGNVFEDYIAWLFEIYSNAQLNLFYDSPSYEHEDKPICDAIVVCGTTAVLIEAKLGTCPADGALRG